MFKQPETRWGAFGIHLVLSILIFIVLAILIVFFWYPGFLFRTDGGWQGIRLIAGIDLILGPLLTLIVYNKQKNSLKMDLSIIAAVQFSALLAGAYLVYSERPIAVIFADGKFSTVSENSFAFHGLEPYEHPLMREKKPVWLYVPAAITEQEKEMAAMQQSHLDQKRYQRLGGNNKVLRSYGRLSVAENEQLDSQTNSRYYKILSRYYEGFLQINLENLEVEELILGRSTDDYGVSG